MASSLASPMQAITDYTAARKAGHIARSALQTGGTRCEANVRTFKMFQEAVLFRRTMQSIQKHLSEFMHATTDLMDGIPTIMCAPLPRVWDSVEGGLAEPIRATTSHGHPNLTGGECDLAGLHADSEHMERMLALDVLTPMQEWTDALGAVQARMAELTRLRSEAQVRATKLDQLQAKVQRKQRRAAGIHRRKPSRIKAIIHTLTHGSYSSGPSASPGMRDQMGDEPTPELDWQQHEARALHKERKLSAIRQSLVDTEQVLYEQLSGLCRDAAWTKTYVTAGLVATKEMFQAATWHLGPTKQPLPSFGFERCGVQRHGQLAPNDSLVQSTPQFIGLTRERGALRLGPHAFPAAAQPTWLHPPIEEPAADHSPALYTQAFAPSGGKDWGAPPSVSTGGSQDLASEVAERSPHAGFHAEAGGGDGVGRGSAWSVGQRTAGAHAAPVLGRAGPGAGGVVGAALLSGKQVVVDSGATGGSSEGGLLFSTRNSSSKGDWTALSGPKPSGGGIFGAAAEAVLS